MSVFKPQLQPNSIGVLGIVLVSWIAIVLVVNGIEQLLEEKARSIVSYSSINNLTPDTDYLKFLPKIFLAVVISIFTTSDLPKS